MVCIVGGMVVAVATASGCICSVVGVASVGGMKAMGREESMTV